MVKDFQVVRVTQMVVYGEWVVEVVVQEALGKMVLVEVVLQIEVYYLTAVMQLSGLLQVTQ
jgi:hypothetical protein